MWLEMKLGAEFVRWAASRGCEHNVWICNKLEEPDPVRGGLWYDSASDRWGKYWVRWAESKLLFGEEARLAWAINSPTAFMGVCQGADFDPERVRAVIDQHLVEG